MDVNKFYSFIIWTQINIYAENDYEFFLEINSLIDVRKRR